MTGFFAILKQVGALADDTSTAIKNTANILSDDIAVTAEQSSNFRASRELPVIWEITKGSFLNKIIIIPIILLLSTYLPSLIVPILLLGATYLSYEGYEKLHEFFFEHEGETAQKDEINAAEEKQNIKQTIQTDFILSIEVVLIALSSVMDSPIVEKVIIVTIVSFLATIGVYGIVALIIRLDDIGMWFARKGYKKVGQVLVSTMGFLVKALAVIGTIAMFLVGGGIFAHDITILHHLQTEYFHSALFIVFDALLGVVVGMVAFFVMSLFKKITVK
jgi:predicted DNA repair protein MutK